MMMARSRDVSLEEFEPRRAWGGFKSGVSLHAHTHHSREIMADLPAYILKIPVVAAIFERELESYAARTGDPIDFSKGWWHPPVSPREVFDGEATQIEQRFGLAPLVSITDHDNVTANVELQDMYAERCAPISFEWTVPYRRGYFHLGVHNLPSHSVAEWFYRLSAFTARPDNEPLDELFEDLNALRDVLIVFNHPCWDLATVGAQAHDSALAAFLKDYGRHVHALEFNGYRSRRENNRVRALASETGLPVISGGDRHGCAVNAVVNLTAARSFGEFANEVRDGVSHVVVMPEYRQHLVARTMACAADVLRRYPWFPPDRQHWTGRVSCLTEGSVHPLSFHWPEGGPLWVRSAITTFQVLASPLVLPILTVALNKVDPGGVGA